MDKPSRTLGERTVAAVLIRALRRRILSGEFPEGRQLRQDAIAAEYGVSRIPVREALRQLEAEGLIIMYPHRGAVIPTLSLLEIAELFELRALLECDVLAHGISRSAPDDFARASAVLDEFEVALGGDRDVGQWGELNWRFHSALYAPAQRPRSMQIIRNLHHNTDRYSRMQLLFTEWQQKAQVEHRELLALCRQGDVLRACAFLKRHVLTAGQALIQFLEDRRCQAVPDDADAASGRVRAVTA